MRARGERANTGQRSGNPLAAEGDRRAGPLVRGAGRESRGEGSAHEDLHAGAWRGALAALLLIAAAGIACYANTLHAPFELDDETAITDNVFIHRLGGAGDVRLLWRWSPFRFVTDLTFAANYAAGGLRVAGYHAVNLAIHIAAAWVVFWLAWMLLETPALRARPPAAWGRVPGRVVLAGFAAVLFVAHPIQTEAVTYVVQRAASLAALLYLLALALYARAALWRVRDGARRRGRRALLLGGCAAAFGLAMLTKENAATLPAAILLLEVCFFPPPAGGGWRGTISRRAAGLAVSFALIGATAAGVFVVRNGGFAGAQRYFGVQASLSHTEYLLTEVNVLRTYLRLLVLPVQQNLDYDYPITHGLDLPTLLSAALLGALLLLAVRLVRRQPLISFGILFFFLALAVESSVIVLPDVIFEHRLYLPMAGAALAVSAAVCAAADRLAARPRAARPPAVRSLLAVAMGLVVVALAAATVVRNAVWADPVRLWADALRQSPHKARVHHDLALAYQNAGRLDDADAEYRAALRYDPTMPKTWNNLANVEQRLGHLAPAEAAYRRALQLDPRFVDAYTNLGFLYQQMGRFDDADKAFRQAQHLGPMDGELLRGLAKLAYRRGKLPAAEYLDQLALRLNPDEADIHNELGVVFYGEGRLDEAAAEYRRALALNPKFAGAYANLGNVLVRQNALPAAEAAYRHALQLDPRLAPAQFNLGLVYQVSGRWQEARAAYRAALALQPDVKTRAQLALVEQHLRQQNR